jgi:hypothetical protein
MSKPLRAFHQGLFNGHWDHALNPPTAWTQRAMSRWAGALIGGSMKVKKLACRR